MLCSMLAGIAAARILVFSDIGENDAAKECISKFAEKKIIEGYGNGKFGYDDICTREQLITLLWRADELKKSGHIAPTDYTTRAEVAVLIKRILDYIKK